jgi:hypothetical protein
MKTKSIFLSKTFWLNLIAFIISVAELIDPTLCTFIGINDPMKFMAIMGLVVAILNKILRMTSSAKVTLTGTLKE